MPIKLIDEIWVKLSQSLNCGKSQDIQILGNTKEQVITIQVTCDPPIALTPTQPRPYAHLTRDPRPDLDDTEKWDKLFKLIWRLPEERFNFKALCALHSVRTVGTLLKWDANFGYKLDPIIGSDNWDDQETYNDMRQRLFLPHTKIWRAYFSLIDS